MKNNQIQIDNLSDAKIQKLRKADDNIVQQFKPEIESVDDINHIDKKGAEANFHGFDFPVHRLEHIVSVEVDSDLIDEVQQQAKFNRKIVYEYTRDEEGRSDAETEDQKSGDATIAEIALAEYLGGSVTDETKHDYDCDVVVDGTKIDVKTTNINSAGYNVPIRRYGNETIQESLDKKDRDLICQSYSVRRNGKLWIGFEFLIDCQKALDIYPVSSLERESSFDWYENESGNKVWRTLSTKNMNMHLLNADVARDDDRLTVDFEDIKN